MTAYPEAVQAAAEALRQRGHACPYHRTPRLPGGLGDCETCLAVVNDARAAVAAAAPHIEAAVRREVRRRVAEDIRAACPDSRTPGWERPCSTCEGNALRAEGNPYGIAAGQTAERCVTCGHRAHPGGAGTRWCTASAAPGTHCHCTTHTDSALPGATDGATSTASVVGTPGNADPALHDDTCPFGNDLPTYCTCAARIAAGQTEGDDRNGSATPPETGAQDNGKADRE